MLDDYKKWKEEYTKKLNDKILRDLELAKKSILNGTGKNKNDSIDDNHCDKKIKLNDDNEVPIVCLPVKYIQ
jgi:hypothetical protein